MSLSTAQLPALKADILADPTLNALPNNSDGAFDIAKVYNLAASPAFWVFRSRVPHQDVVDATSFSDLANITALNNSRYTTIMGISPNGIVPSVDRRDAFEDIFSGAAGATTRVKLGTAGTAWKHQAKRGEKLYADTSGGNGANATPAALVFEGDITTQDVQEARNLP
jgi:hypothetical protein